MIHASKATLPSLRPDRARSRALQTRLMLAAERGLEMRLAQAIAAAGRRAADAARHGESVDAALAGLPAQLARVLVASLVEIGRMFGALVIRGPKSAHAFPIERKAFEDLDAAIREYTTRSTARRVVAISRTLRATIKRVVTDGIADQIGQDALARRIVEATSGQIGLARARRIARTEVHNAAMHGQFAAAEASPLEFEKVWLATEDARTRTSHANANGQRVAMNELFVLETPTGKLVRLRYPGDPEAPAGETINCRCACQFEPLATPKPKPSLDRPAEPFFRRPAEIEEPDRPDPDAEPGPFDEPLEPFFPEGEDPDAEGLDELAPGLLPEDAGGVEPSGTPVDLDNDYVLTIGPEPVAVDRGPEPIDFTPAEPEPAAPLQDRLLADAARALVEAALVVVLDRDRRPNDLAAQLARDLDDELATSAPGSATEAIIAAAVAELEAIAWSRLRLRDRLDELLADLEIP